MFHDENDVVDFWFQISRNKNPSVPYFFDKERSKWSVQIQEKMAKQLKYEERQKQKREKREQGQERTRKIREKMREKMRDKITNPN